MKRLQAACFVVLSLLILVPNQAFASAFGLGESSTASQGRMHATTARLDEPGTIFKNVAGMSLLPGLQISLGAAVIHGSGNFTDTYEDTVIFEDTSITLTKPVPNLAITYNLGSVTLGFGLYAPYGMTIDWGEDLGGEPLCNNPGFASEPCAVSALKTEYDDNHGIIKRAGLEIPHFVLGASMELAEGLFLGLSAQLAPPKLTKVEFWKYQAAFPSKLTGDSMGVGGSLGLMYRPNDSVFLGVQYKSRMKLTFNGKAEVMNKDGDAWTALGETPVVATITLPDEINVGIGFQTGDWYVEADAGMSLWSLFENLTILEDNDEKSTLSVTNLEWDNGFFYRLGAEWSGAENMIIRLGAGFEQTPVPDHTISPMLPDSDRLLGSMGMTYVINENYALDFSYTYLQFLEREVDDSTDNPIRGTYSTAAHIGGLNFRYSR